MTPGDRAKQKATVLSQVTINSVVFNRYSMETHGADAGHITFRNSLGVLNVADNPSFNPRAVPLLIESGSAWITIVGVVRRNAVGANGEIEVLARADDVSLIGSSQGTPPVWPSTIGFTWPSALNTVAAVVTVSMAPSVGASNAIDICGASRVYGFEFPVLWPLDIAGLSAEEQRTYGYAAQEFPVDLNATGVVAIGRNAGAIGNGAVAIGIGAAASRTGCVAVGKNVGMDKPYACGIGHGLSANVGNSFQYGAGEMYLPVNAYALELFQTTEVSRLHTGTTNATPKQIEMVNPADDLPFVESGKFTLESGITIFKCTFTAVNLATEETKLWTYDFAIKNLQAYSAAALFGSVTKTVVVADANTASWDITHVLDAPNDLLHFEVTGAAAKDIAWMATVSIETHVYWS